ncbi:MAG: glutathione peroxidase [Gammaproteobacteria bacterium]|nr:glutathione peroxidase [Gammaproteobacteria bacterium]
MSIYQFSATDIKGADVSLSDFQGKVLLIVNTASKCGFTPQFEGLENLYKDLHEQGLEVLGFPCNQFGSQDPGDEGQIEEFCQLNYGVSFPMFSKIEVNGKGAHPLYQYLKKEAKGLLGSEKIKWNFTKFLINKEGGVVARYGSMDKPEDIRSDIEALL